VTPEPSTLAPGDAIALFVGVSSLLLALLAACLGLLAPGQGFKFKMGVTPKQLATATFICIVVMTIGATAAWIDLYIGGSWRGVLPTIIAGCLIVGIAFPTIAAYYLFRGFRR
jgi:hypothetical protein